ncbi:hypothetical protein ACJ2A9_12130 [Anaerobacillus sp. MEB173]|uniref:hypothetical protein n=1 Tax=Anaerobacillus sp. MEB173 TaxID=3383345 RepID=UPI003F8F6452
MKLKLLLFVLFIATTLTACSQQINSDITILNVITAETNFTKSNNDTFDYTSMYSDEDMQASQRYKAVLYGGKIPDQEAQDHSANGETKKEQTYSNTPDNWVPGEIFDLESVYSPEELEAAKNFTVLYQSRKPNSKSAIKSFNESDETKNITKNEEQESSNKTLDNNTTEPAQPFDYETMYSDKDLKDADKYKQELRQEKLKNR